MSAFQQIVDLIAVYPPSFIFSRIIESFNRVSNCRRGVSLSSFVSGFPGLAYVQLIHTGTSPNSKIGEVLTIITEANLGDATHQAAKIQVINTPKARKYEESSKTRSRAK